MRPLVYVLCFSATSMANIPVSFVSGASDPLVSDIEMNNDLLCAWLTARSAARGLDAPVPDRGGFRVDTNSDNEICRWVFRHPCEGLRELGRSLLGPGYLLKMCGSGEDLLAQLPETWTLQPPRYFMIAAKPFHLPMKALPTGYSLVIDTVGLVASVEIRSPEGVLAARGYAAAAAGVFVYDRIETQPEHRRLGLGTAIMRALGDARDAADGLDLLVATDDGRKLYDTLGWRSLSDYSTAEEKRG